MTFNRRGPLLLLLILVFTGCEDSNTAAKGESDDEESPPVPVEIETPTRGDIHAVYTGTAPLEAFAEADVVAKVAGEVRSILVEEGDIVKKGQVLARLDGDRLRLELNESEARLKKLQRDYDRNIDLSSKGLISAGDFEKIKYDMEALRATHALAKLELDYTQIRAPIDGVISERFIKVGNTLAVNEQVFRVTGFDPLVVYLHVPEREFNKIKVGQPVSLQIDALSASPIVANVSRVSPIIDPVSGTFKVTIEISDQSRRIKPGMFARIGIIYDNHHDALQIPRSALLEQLGQASVFVVEDAVAVRKNVEVGYTDRGRVEITSGLSDQDEVIIVGQLGLKTGARVNIINAPDGDAQNASTD